MRARNQTVVPEVPSREGLHTLEPTCTHNQTHNQRKQRVYAHNVELSRHSVIQF